MFCIAVDGGSERGSRRAGLPVGACHREKNRKGFVSSFSKKNEEEGRGIFLLVLVFVTGLSVVAMQAVPVVVTPAAAVVGVQEVEEQAAVDVQQQADQNGGTIVAVAAAPPLPPAAAAAAAVVAPPSPPVRPLPPLQAAVGVIGTVTSGVVPLLPRQIVYPLALAKHEEVVASKETFLDTLNKFHTTLGTRLT